MQTDQSKIKARDLCVLLIGKGKWWLAASVILILAHPAYGISIELDDARPYGSVGTPAVNKSNLAGSGGVLFETCFEPDEFTGDVVARKISSAGVVNHDVSHADGHVKDDPTGGIVEGDNALWRAHEKLRSHDQRIIFTSGYEFQWGDLPEDFQDEIDLEGSVNNHGENVVAWIRGDDSNEGVFAHEFRVRLKKDQAGNEVHYPLGDFVHSAIQYVGPPSKLRVDEGYSEFFIANKDRAPAVYAGANDGMLHAFNAKTGEELFAYIPQGVFSSLERLSSQSYAQTYYVDGTTTIDTAFAGFEGCPDNAGGGGCWRSILVGGLNSGGQSIYALDVTNPEPLDESNGASDIFIWEFFDEHLGYSFSRPIIEKLHDGKWVVIFGSGIRSLGTDKAYLFIVDIKDGSLIQKIEIPSRSITNGLFSATGFDQNFDGVVDYVYAGDTDGSLWKFDLTGIDDSDEFEGKIAYTDGFVGLPLVRVTGKDENGKSTNLVIQTAPVVTTTDDGTVLVVFGTGHIFGEADGLKKSGDSLFGILDNADISTGHGTFDPVNSSSFPLITNTLTTITKENGNIRKSNSPSDLSDPIGWRVILDLGERILADLVLSSKRIGFTSINSTVGNGSNWLNGVDYLSGGPPSDMFFDTNDDGLIDNNDLEGGEIPVSIDLGSGIYSGPRVANIDGGFDVNLVSNRLRREEPRGSDPIICDPGSMGGYLELGAFDSESVETCWVRGKENSGEGGGSGGNDYDSSGSGGAEQNPYGKIITRATVVNSAVISSSRVSWREVLEE